MQIQKLLNLGVLLALLMTLGFGSLFTLSSQTARNPVIEFCTGTW